MRARGWVGEAFEPIGTKSGIFDDLEAMVTTIVSMARAGDHVLVMSNGGFGGVHGKILAKLAEREMSGKDAPQRKT
jgi:UDP-N-acetylmuramate: L-alanyl-gamma-D-glutamyl-meso-diaminopimelate ligase